MQSGALLLADSWRTVPLRLAPWLSSVRAAKVRCVSDLSRGVDSMNDCTRRGPQLRARLAKWSHFLGHILWLKQQCPGEDVVLVKFDVKRAFRQCSVPVRCRWKAAHTLFEVLGEAAGRRFVHTVLSLGATCSVDSMSEPLCALRDVLVRLYRCFIASYVDDWVLVTTRARAPFLIGVILSCWMGTDWQLSAAKFELEGVPSTLKDFLGVAVDTVLCVARITPARLLSLHALLSEWLASGFVPTDKRLRSLAGTLNFVAACVPFGRVFMSTLYRSKCTRGSATALSVELRDDLLWWQQGLHHLSGGVSFGATPVGMPVAHVSTDAAKAG